jgi:hypothetical protein
VVTSSALGPDGVLAIMYEDFSTIERWTGASVRCVYQCMMLAVATRHADAVDVKFLVDGHPVWIALALPAWAEYQRQTGNKITDPMAVEIAGHYLRGILENGEESGRDIYTLTTAETLQHLDAVLKQTALPAGR